MKKKYITLEQVLDYRGTDTKIYSDNDDNYDYYWQFHGDVLCQHEEVNNKLICVGSYLDYGHKNLYILEEEDDEFKVKKVGLYKTRNGKLAFVGLTDSEVTVKGYIEGQHYSTCWYKDGKYISNCSDNDLVEYIGD